MRFAPLRHIQATTIIVWTLAGTTRDVDASLPLVLSFWTRTRYSELRDGPYYFHSKLRSGMLIEGEISACCGFRTSNRLELALALQSSSSLYTFHLLCTTEPTRILCNMSSSRSPHSTTSARNGWPNDPFATPRFHTEIVSPLAFEGAAQTRSIRSARSLNNARNGWPDDVSATGFPAAHRDEELVSPLVWGGTPHRRNFPTSPASSRGNGRTITPLFASQSVQNGTNTRPTTPGAHPSPLASVHGRDYPRTPHFAAQNMQYHTNSRPTNPLAHSNTDTHSIGNYMAPVVGNYHSPSGRSRTVSNLTLPVHNQGETHSSRKITITTTTTISLPSSYNPAIFVAPLAPPSQGVVVHHINKGVPLESRHHMDPLEWGLSTIGSLTGPAQNEAAFNTVHSEYDRAKLQRPQHHANPAKGHRVRHESHRAPSQVRAHPDIHVTAPASRPLDRHPHVLSKSRPDRRRSRSYSDLEARTRDDSYFESRYALPAHESTIAINSNIIEAEGKKPANGPKKGRMIQLLKSDLKGLIKRW